MILSCICIFVTTYMLILPAITIDRQSARAGDGFVIGDLSAALENAQDSSDLLAGTVTVTGSDYAITAEVPSSARLPKEARLTASEIRGEEYDIFYAQALSALGVKSMPFVRFFDIRFEVFSDDAWITVEPEDAVRISVDTGRTADEGEMPVAVHFTETSWEGDQPYAGNSEEQELSGAEDAGWQPAYEIDGVEIPEPEVLTAEAGDTEISFETQSFSVFGVGYTVDFHNGEYTFSIPGGTFIWLSDVFNELHMDISVADLVDVEFSDEALIDVEYVCAEELATASGEVPEGVPAAEPAVAGNEAAEEISASEPAVAGREAAEGISAAESAGAGSEAAEGISAEETGDADGEAAEGGETRAADFDWRLTSLKAFASQEYLTLTMADGTVRYLAVTDDGESGNVYHTDLVDLLVPGSLKSTWTARKCRRVRRSTCGTECSTTFLSR